VNWNLVYTARKVFADSPFQIGRLFYSSILIVRVSSAEAQPSWSSAGTLFPILDIPDIGLTEGIGRKAYLKTKALRFENLGLPFDLKFRSVGYLPSVTLSIWEPDVVFLELSQQQLLADIQRIENQLEFIARRDIPTIYDVQ